MVKQSSGYTLIELMVVLAVICFIATIAFYGIKSYDNSQAVINEQLDFVNQLRSEQNKVINGADGLNTRSVSIPAGATVNPSTVTVICFNNPNLTSSACTNVPVVTVSFSTKNVIIESSGLNVTRIYAQ